MHVPLPCVTDHRWPFVSNSYFSVNYKYELFPQKAQGDKAEGRQLLIAQAQRMPLGNPLQSSDWLSQMPPLCVVQLERL